MAKTKEELNELKERCIKLSDEIKQLDDDELNIVTGGKDGRATRTINGITFSGHVRKYDGIVGHYYYVTDDDENEWYYGKLTKTWESGVFFFWSQRTHIFQVEIANGEPCSEEKEFSGDHNTMYLYKS